MAELSPEDRKRLLRIAREAVAAAVKGEPPPAVPPETKEGALAEPKGAFVTLKTHGQLRGCLGHFEADMPLADCVADMARASALEDPRFTRSRIRPDELDKLELDISILSPRERIADPLDFRLGRDGVYVKKGLRSGTYLPQVATEFGWDKEQFLSSLCSHKAGLAADAWKDPETEVYRYAAEVIEDAPEG